MAERPSHFELPASVGKVDVACRWLVNGNTVIEVQGSGCCAIEAWCDNDGETVLPQLRRRICRIDTKV